MITENRKIQSIRKTKVRKRTDWGYVGIMAILVMGATYLIFGFIEQQMNINTLREEKEELEAQIHEEQQAIEQIKNNLKEIESPAFIERQAREILGMVKPDEKVYVDLNKRE